MAIPFNTKNKITTPKWESVIADPNPLYQSWSSIKRNAAICMVHPKVAQCLSNCKEDLTAAETIVEIDEKNAQQVKAKQLLDKTLFNNPNFNFRQLQHEMLSSMVYGNALFNAFYNPITKHLENLNYVKPQTINEFVIKNNEFLAVKVNTEDGEKELPNIQNRFLLITNDRLGDNFYGSSKIRYLFTPIKGIGMPLITLLADLIKRASGQLVIEVTDQEVFANSIDYLETKGIKYTDIEAQIQSVTSGNAQTAHLIGGIKISAIPNAHTLPEVLEVGKYADDIITDVFNQTWLNGMSKVTGSYALSKSMAGKYYKHLTGFAKSINEQLQSFLNPYVKHHCGVDCPRIKTLGIEDSNITESLDKIKLLHSLSLIDIESDEGREALAKQLDLPVNLLAKVPLIEQTAETETPEQEDQQPEQAQLSQPVEFAQKHPIHKLMDNAQQELVSIVQNYFADNQETFVKKTLKQWDAGKLLDSSIGNKPKLYKAVKQYISKVVTQTTDITLDKSGLTAGDLKKPVKLADAQSVEFAQNDASKVVNALIIRELNKLINIYHDNIFNALENVNIDSPAIAKAKIEAVSDEFINGKLSAKEQDGSPSIKLAAAMLAAKVVNQTRAAIVKDPVVDARIESYEYMNGDPKSAICQELANRVFDKQEYAASSNKPPLHQRCKSWIRIQYIGNTNKPLSRASNGQPLGLGNVSAEALKSISL